MQGRIALLVAGLGSAMLVGCVDPASYYGSGYSGYYGYGNTAKSVAPAETTQMPAAPAQTAVVPAQSAPAAAQVADNAPQSFALPPLELPVREEWSSQRCSDLSVTFSGRSEPARTSTSDVASFEEARQVRDNDYYEAAECFCAKSGDLSRITKPTADAVMAQTARFLDTSHMRIRRSAFVEGTPLGSYSELDAEALPPSDAVVTLRTYWRAQCSMRLETMATPAGALRAAQFLNSLRAVNVAGSNVVGSSADKTEAPMQAHPPLPVAIAPLSEDFGNRVRERSMELQDKAGAAAPTDQSDDADADADQALPAGAADRLAQLQALRDRGLITPGEYQEKRQAILRGL